ncbi:transposable element Tcb2 transposase [Trichonephila clavipes]|nr:transposable element Tcb2 transposase [Trichonephila clavipes]
MSCYGFEIPCKTRLGVETRTLQGSPITLRCATTLQQWSSGLFTDESIFSLEKDSGSLLIWREQHTGYLHSNTIERYSYRGGGIMVWARIPLGGRTDLQVFHGGTLSGVRYRDEILEPHVRLYAGAIDSVFILRDDVA